MIKGLYSAVSAMVMNANRQQVISHNIANLQTPGFKQILTTAQDFMPEQAVYTNGNLQTSPIEFVGTLGLGTQVGQEFIDFGAGAMQNTNNPLDFALQGSGFFTVKTPDGNRYTRDGRFLRDAENTLVTVDGYQVLDDAGQAIELPDGEVSVSPEGILSVNGTEVATLGIGVFADPEAELEHTEGNLFTGPAASTGEEVPQVVQGYLETSNANPSQLMTQLVEVGRSYEAAQKLVQNQDELLGKTIASLGRIG
ncbi:MAG TPA: flagellar hook-basal body protein [Anaerolineales bacterium]|nr:flagellar hook-basal body protein [Anaerolineales bacterium]HMZ05989.1 flagellar hook-basal body protein [Anaerolineales bacterium]HNA87835.1 flagellar hook-basal body protein [Anaerolineales bacterium]HNC88383.1 flagellar hook-basal body protein [Anaerolineales bacterium]HND91539.1 flagellar hook-basal body protein [Anaerolineales bacterium]